MNYLYDNLDEVYPYHSRTLSTNPAEPAAARTSASITPAQIPAGGISHAQSPIANNSDGTRGKIPLQSTQRLSKYHFGSGGLDQTLAVGDHQPVSQGATVDLRGVPNMASLRDKGAGMQQPEGMTTIRASGVGNTGGFLNPRHFKPRVQKMRWSAEKDRQLLLLGLGREIETAEYAIIANSFQEKPTPKAIQERLAKLRREQLEVLRSIGILSPVITDIYDLESEDAESDPSTSINVDQGSAYVPNTGGTSDTEQDGTQNLPASKKRKIHVGHKKVGGRLSSLSATGTITTKSSNRGVQRARHKVPEVNQLMAHEAGIVIPSIDAEQSPYFNANYGV